MATGWSTPLEGAPGGHALLLAAALLLLLVVVLPCAVCAVLVASPGLYLRLLQHISPFRHKSDGTKVAVVPCVHFPWGNVHAIRSDFQSYRMAALETMQRNNQACVLFRFFRPFLLVAGPKHAKHVSSAEISIRKSERNLGKSLPLWGLLFGESLFMVGPAQWKRQHKIISHAFGSAHTRGFFPRVLEEVLQMMEGLGRATAQLQQRQQHPEEGAGHVDGADAFVVAVLQQGDARLAPASSAVDDEDERGSGGEPVVVTTPLTHVPLTTIIYDVPASSSSTNGGPDMSTGTDGGEGAVLEMDLQELFKALALRVITSVAIGTPETQSSTSSQLQQFGIHSPQYMAEVVDMIRMAGRPRYLSTWWDVIPTAEVRSVHARVRKLHAVGGALVEEKRGELRAAAADGGASQDDGAGRRASPTLLHVLSAACDAEAGALSTHEVVSNVLGFVAAGVDTTSSTLTHVAAALAQHQRVQRKLREEIDASGIFASARAQPGTRRRQRRRAAPDDEGDDAAANKEDAGKRGPQLAGDELLERIDSLKYLSQVLREAMRLSPAIIGTPTRVLTEDSVVSDFICPKGSQVRLDSVVGHLDPSVWGEDAQQFRPERFDSAEGSIKVEHLDYKFLTFGAGVRPCIGRHLSVMEMKTALVMLLHRYEVVPMKGHDITTALEMPLYKVATGTRLGLRPRR